MRTIVQAKTRKHEEIGVLQNRREARSQEMPAVYERKDMPALFETKDMPALYERKHTPRKSDPSTQ